MTKYKNGRAAQLQYMVTYIRVISVTGFFIDQYKMPILFKHFMDMY